jgi:hypothetical protein
MRSVLVAFAGGILVGGAVGWIVVATPKVAIERPALALPPPESPAVPVTPTRELASSERVSADPSAPAPATTSSGGSDELITEALRAYARTRISKGWARVRQDEIGAEELAEGMKRFERLVLDSPFGIGRALGEQRTKAEQALEDARTGGAFALLAKLDEGGVGPVPTLVKDAGEFEALFQRSGPEQQLNALTVDDHPDKHTSDSTTLTWPAGVFKVENLMEDKDPYPRDVTLVGAGMDATMLVVSEDLSTNGPLRDFAIRDCTVYTPGYLFDLRREPATIRFDRVRFVGSDTGAGCSCLFYTRPLALYARHCRFDGGYGRSPQHAGFIDVRTDALLARFEGCTFSLLEMHAQWWQPGATLLFLGCSFDRVFSDPTAHAADKPGVIFDGCSVSVLEGGPQNAPQLDLNALFPDWKARMED